ncbi:MAG: PAS domain S-box protein, partial [Methylophilaceae bacterium]|nr:PAS domain S-box protein [Methylophilaceae bacterium]
RLGLEGDDELAHLGQSFDHMTERLQMIWEEHGRQQQALAEANAELRGLQQALDAHATVSITNPAGTIVYVNDHFCQVTGYTREELLGQNHRLLKSGAHPPEFYRDMWETITRGEIWQGVVENRNKNGNHYWVQTTIVPLHDATGTIRKFISVRTDITNQKKVENALKIASQYARSLIEASLDPMIAIGSVGKITDVNHATETVTGLPRSQLIGSDFSSYFTEPDKAQAGYHQAVQQGAVVGVPLSIRHTSGKVIEVLYNASLYYDAEGNMAGVLVVMRDITDLKQLQAEQERLRTQLQQAQKMEAIGQLTGGIAHDFNNILAAILGYTGLALERCVPDKESKLASYLQEVQTAAERARDLIAKMLAFSRGIKGTSVALDAAPLVKECVKMLRSMIPTTIALDTRIDAKLPPIQSDPVQLHQILVNLAINARDAIESSGRIEFVLSHPGQVRETCDSCHHAFDGDYVELAVQDTGCGIAPEIMQRIFEPFFTTKEVGKGSGMGLPMVHGIMHEHGGHIRVHSPPGQGTTSRLLFPVATVPEREAAETAAPAPAPAVTVSGRIVVVDDEPAVGRMLAEVLQTHGHHPTFYPDAGSALATLAAEPHSCDLVITDQTMPGTTGVELAQKLHALRPDLPVFLCTGYSDQMDAQSALRSGITRIFQKPVDSQVLLRAIQETLASLKADAS